MSSFETYRPQLKKGIWKASGGRHIFQCDVNSDFVVALSESEFELSRFFDGEKTISDIVHDLYEKNKSVSFRHIIATIQKLAKSECLEGNASWIEKMDNQPQAQMLKKHSVFEPIFRLPVLRSLAGMNFGLNWIIFLSAPMIILSLYSFFTFKSPVDGGAFLKIDDSYFWGVVLFYITSSVLLTLKGIWKVLVNFIASDSVPQCEISIGFFATNLDLHDEAQLTQMSKKQLFFYLFGSAVFTFFVLGVFKFFVPESHFLNHFFVIASILALIDLDPYVRSDTTRFLQKWSEQFKMVELVPYLRKRSLSVFRSRGLNPELERYFVIYATIGVLWTFVAYNFAIDLTNKILPNLGAAILDATILSKLSAAIIIFWLIALNIFLIVDLISILGGNLLHPFANKLFAQFRNFGGVVAEKPAFESLSNTLKQLPLFDGLDEKTLRQYYDASGFKVFRSKVRILIQGTPALETYVLLKGKVKVIKREPSGWEHEIAELSAPAIFGESALVDQGVRLADVVSDGAIEVLVCNKSGLESIRQVHSDGNINLVLNRIMVQQAMSGSPLFKNMPRESVEAFRSKGTFENVSDKEILLREGEPGNNFYFIVRGQVEISKNGAKIAELKQGDVFGEMALLTNAPRSATAKATGPGNVFKITKEAFWSVLETNLRLAALIESVAESRGEAVK